MAGVSIENVMALVIFMITDADGRSSSSDDEEDDGDLENSSWQCKVCERHMPYLAIVGRILCGDKICVFCLLEKVHIWPHWCFSIRNTENITDGIKQYMNTYLYKRFEIEPVYEAWNIL